jgi:hypothetical protein
MAIMALSSTSWLVQSYARGKIKIMFMNYLSKAYNLMGKYVFPPFFSDNIYLLSCDK